MSKYDYYIETEELHPPIGGVYRFAAKVGGLVKVTGPHSTERISHSFGEVWGRTREEAEEKLRKQIDDWIAEHQ
jgi:hypothetical protein